MSVTNNILDSFSSAEQMTKTKVSNSLGVTHGQELDFQLDIPGDW